MTTNNSLCRRQIPWTAVVPCQQHVGHRVLDELLRLRVELDRAADSVGDVAEVAESGADVADFDVGGGARTRADAVQEVLVVRGGAVAGVAGD